MAFAEDASPGPAVDSPEGALPVTDRPDRIHDPELDRLVEELNRERSPEVGDRPVEEAAGASGVPPGLGGVPPRGPDGEESLPPLGAPQGRVGEDEPLAELLRAAVRAGASDLLLVPGHPPTVRVDGALRALEDGAPLDGEEVSTLFGRHVAAGVEHGELAVVSQRPARADRYRFAVRAVQRLDGVDGESLDVCHCQRFRRPGL